MVKKNSDDALKIKNFLIFFYHFLFSHNQNFYFFLLSEFFYNPHLFFFKIIMSKRIIIPPIKTRGLSIEELKNLTLKDNGVQILPKPLFTPKQCEYIWNETVEFMNHNSIHVPATNKTEKPYTKIIAHSDRNFFGACGKPVVGYVIMTDMLKVISETTGIPPSDLVCSLEGFFYQNGDCKQKDTELKFIIDEHVNKTYDKYMTRCFLQVTPSQKGHSCFTSFVRDDTNNDSEKDICSIITRQYTTKKTRTLSTSDIEILEKLHGKPVIFDNESISAGTVFLIDSNNVPTNKIAAGSKRLVFYFAFWRKDLTLYPFIVEKTMNLRYAYILNRMTHHAIHIVQFPNTCSNRSGFYTTTQYFEHPKLDTDQMAQLLGFKDLEDVEKKRSKIERKHKHIKPISKIFSHVRSHEKTLTIVRKELDESYNRLKRRVVYDSIVEEHIPTPETKKQCLVSTEEVSESSNTKYDDDDSILANIILEDLEKSYVDDSNRDQLVVHTNNLLNDPLLDEFRTVHLTDLEKQVLNCIRDNRKCFTPVVDDSIISSSNTNEEKISEVIESLSDTDDQFEPLDDIITQDEYDLDDCIEIPNISDSSSQDILTQDEDNLDELVLVSDIDDKCESQSHDEEIPTSLSSETTNECLQVHEETENNQRTLILYCRNLYIGLRLFQQITGANTFAGFLDDIKTKKPVMYNTDTKLYEPIDTSLIHIKHMTIIENKKNNMTNHICARFSDKEVYTIGSNQYETILNKIYELSSISKTRFYNDPKVGYSYINDIINLSGKIESWTNDLYDRIIIHPIADYSEFSNYLTCRGFNHKTEQMTMIIDSIIQLRSIRDHIEKLRFELFDVMDKEGYQLEFMISEKIFTESDSNVLDEYKDILKYGTFNYDTSDNEQIL